jgi:hypothetical protein
MRRRELMLVFSAALITNRLRGSFAAQHEVSSAADQCERLNRRAPCSQLRD